MLKQLSEIGQQVERKRAALGWNQTKLALESGVSRQTISRIETGVAQDAKWSVLTKLHNALDGLEFSDIPNMLVIPLVKEETCSE